MVLGYMKEKSKGAIKGTNGEFLLLEAIFTIYLTLLYILLTQLTQTRTAAAAHLHMAGTATSD